VLGRHRKSLHAETSARRPTLVTENLVAIAEDDIVVQLQASERGGGVLQLLLFSGNSKSIMPF
jgi:hypothetical protein